MHEASALLHSRMGHTAGELGDYTVPMLPVGKFPFFDGCWVASGEKNIEQGKPTCFDVTDEPVEFEREITG